MFPRDAIFGVAPAPAALEAGSTQCNNPLAKQNGTEATAPERLPVGRTDAPHNPVAVRRTDRTRRRLGLRAKCLAAQPGPVRAGRPARPHRDPSDRACDGRGARQGRQLQKLPFAVPDLHHDERLGDGQRSLPRRYRHLQQHDLHRPPRFACRRRSSPERRSISLPPPISSRSCPTSTLASSRPRTS